MPVTLADIRGAARRIAGHVYASPCPESIPLSEITGSRVYCKLDNLQRTGSFKERGACNALRLLDPSQRKRGVIAASAGNHALGLAYHGRLLGIPVTVVMPEVAPLIKITTCQRLGARVVLEGADFSEARTIAARLSDAEGLRYVHGFDDPAIIAGQGTLGLEILRQLARVDAIVVPIGGGGLLAGVATAVKALRPAVQVIGVESVASASFAAAMEAGHPVEIALQPSLADGLAVRKAGENAFAVARNKVDRVVTVAEDWIALAILRLAELEKTVVEGAAAASLAALMSGVLPELKGRRVVLCLSGGNIDPTVLGRVIEKGLVADGRLARFTVVVRDRPGGLAALAKAIGESGASIKDITHDRAFSGPDVSTVQCSCTVETRDAAHVRTLHRALEQAGFRLVPTARVPARGE